MMGSLFGFAAPWKSPLEKALRKLSSVDRIRGARPFHGSATGEKTQKQKVRKKMPNFLNGERQTAGHPQDPH